MSVNQNNMAGIQQVSNQWLTDITNQITNQVSMSISNQFSATLNRISMKVVNKPVYNIVNNYTAAYTQIESSLNGAVQAQKKMNEAADEGTEGAKNQVDHWKNLTDTFNNVKGVMEKVLKPAAEQQKMEDLFKAKTGNDDVGSAMFEKFKQRAVETGQDVNKSLQGVMSFLPMTKNTDQLDQLMDYSTRMSMLSPEDKGIGDTSAAISSAFGGDSKNLRSMLQIPEGDLPAGLSGALETMDKMAKAKDMSGFMSALDSVMNKAGMTSAAMQTMMDSPVNQWQTLLGNYHNTLATVGEGALQAFAPLLIMLNEAFTSGSFQPVIDAFSIGLALLAQGFSAVVQGAMWLWNVLSTTLPFILPVIMGIVSALLLYQLVMGAITLATTIASIAQGIYNAILLANPMTLIIGLIIALVLAFLGIIAAVQPVRDFFASMFRELGGIVSSFVGYVMDLWTGFINGIITAANFLLSGVNEIIGALGKFIGIESTINLEIGKIDSSQFKQDVQLGIESSFDSAAEVTQNFNLDSIKGKLGMGGNSNSETTLNQWNTTNKGSKPLPLPTVPVVPTLPTVPQGPTPPGLTSPGNGSNINHVNSVGKINDTVNISSDDLTMLRELAEIQAIQNFVELTPTVQVTTGNINNAGDIDTIINKIGQKLNEEFISTAQGVYT
ncbi:hypothetical protein [Paenibacillus wynnii]|uniref:Uncharacterized protein n=1 Tax=Paenibacillus wynnii TaxID=268407 RepID=A0A098MGA0_9BACL|nr:hypothetical protein [Paenibacillus wynnii]KGE21076.1 hypothetical protein PWYN_02675 [Paenibacillus wynnii]